MKNTKKQHTFSTTDFTVVYFFSGRYVCIMYMQQLRHFIHYQLQCLYIVKREKKRSKSSIETERNCLNLLGIWFCAAPQSLLCPFQLCFVNDKRVRCMNIYLCKWGQQTANMCVQNARKGKTTQTHTHKLSEADSHTTSPLLPSINMQ